MSTLSTLTRGLILVGLCSLNTLSFAASSLSYPIVDTNQTVCSDLSQNLSSCPASGEATYGQDAQYQGLAPSYTNNGDGTVSDNQTGLMWSQTTDINGDGKITADDKLSYDEAQAYAKQLTLGGHSDWRVPTIKELYSLILFDGQDPSGLNGAGDYSLLPFIDIGYFDFNAGDMAAGERLIDSQYISSTKYVSTTMKGDETVFGVNFIDGRIKGYGLQSPRDGSDKTFYLLVVRGNLNYGQNEFQAQDGVVIDNATGLTWQQGDSGQSMDFSSALGYCENLELAGSSDWRLPNVKELQSIVDYSKSPQTTSTAAIDSVFNTSGITNEAGQIDYGNYWSSTTHANMNNAKSGAYVAFGRSLGYMNNAWIDVHGAGSQRSDPKQGDASQYPTGHGPQGDAIRVDNMVRCVTGGDTVMVNGSDSQDTEQRSLFHFSLTGNESDMMQAPNSEGTKGMKGGQSQATTGSKRDPFAQMDRNQDGKLSKSEVRGPLANDFDRIDANGDGYISKSELPKKPR